MLRAESSILIKVARLMLCFDSTNIELLSLLSVLLPVGGAELIRNCPVKKVFINVKRYVTASTGVVQRCTLS